MIRDRIVKDNFHVNEAHLEETEFDELNREQDNIDLLASMENELVKT